VWWLIWVAGVNGNSSASFLRTRTAHRKLLAGLYLATAVLLGINACLNLNLFWEQSVTTHNIQRSKSSNALHQKLSRSFDFLASPMLSQTIALHLHFSLPCTTRLANHDLLYKHRHLRHKSWRIPAAMCQPLTPAQATTQQPHARMRAVISHAASCNTSPIYRALGSCQYPFWASLASLVRAVGDGRLDGSHARSA
jgi:hypothetical protein